MNVSAKLLTSIAEYTHIERNEYYELNKKSEIYPIFQWAQCLVLEVSKEAASNRTIPNHRKDN